jgi:CheY-like chemotaxis protein
VSAHLVLVVDDDPDIRETMLFVLENAGYQVTTAANGAEALALLRAQASPCLILLDLMMPVMNGWQFLLEQTRDPRLADIPVVVISGAGAQVLRVNGVAGALQKPVELDEVLSTVRTYC